MSLDEIRYGYRQKNMGFRQFQCLFHYSQMLVMSIIWLCWFERQNIESDVLNFESKNESLEIEFDLKFNESVFSQPKFNIIFYLFAQSSVLIAHSDKQFLIILEVIWLRWNMKLLFFKLTFIFVYFVQSRIKCCIKLKQWCCWKIYEESLPQKPSHS